MFRVINTDTLELLIWLDRGGTFDTCHLSRESITARVVVPCDGLTDIVNTGRFRSLRLLTLSKSGGVGFTCSEREGRDSLLVVDTDGAMGS